MIDGLKLKITGQELCELLRDRADRCATKIVALADEHDIVMSLKKEEAKLRFIVEHLDAHETYLITWYEVQSAIRVK